MREDKLRQHKRARINARVIAHDQQDFEYLECTTISEGGLFLFAKRNIWVTGSTLKLNIKGNGLAQALLAEAVVLNHVLGEKKGFCLKFSKISEEDRALIHNYVEQYVKENECNFYLNGIPLTHNFEITVNGKEIPYDPDNGWVYNIEKNAVIFRGTYTPKKGDKISFTFKDTL